MVFLYKRIILGNGILFPGTYKRSTSLQISAMRALRILIGTIPLFIIAGTLESFVTRLTEMPTALKVLIIVASSALILFMWVFYPWYYSRKMGGEVSDVDIIPFADDPVKANKMSYRRFESNISLSIIHYKDYIGSVLKNITVPFMVVGAILFWFSLQSVEVLSYLEKFSLFYYEQSNLLLFFFFLIAAASCIIYISYTYLEQENEGVLVHIKRNFLSVLLITALLVFPFYFIENGWLVFLVYLVFTPHFLVIFSLRFAKDRNLGFINNFSQSIKEAFRFYLNFIPQYLISALFFFAIYLAFNATGIGVIIQEILMWHEIFDTGIAADTFYYHLTLMFSFFIAIPFFYYTIADNYYSLLCQKYGYDLEKRFEKFGSSSVIFETT